MKNQVLFSPKDKSKKLKCRLLQFLFGALRVKTPFLLLEKKLTFLRNVATVDIVVNKPKDVRWSRRHSFCGDR